MNNPEPTFEDNDVQESVERIERALRYGERADRISVCIDSGHGDYWLHHAGQSFGQALLPGRWPLKLKARRMAKARGWKRLPLAGESFGYGFGVCTPIASWGPTDD